MTRKCQMNRDLRVNGSDLCVNRSDELLDTAKLHENKNIG